MALKHLLIDVSLFCLLTRFLCPVSANIIVVKGDEVYYSALDRVSDFGPPTTEDSQPVSAFLVQAFPDDACTAINPVPNNETRFAALIARSRFKCDYVTKVLNAQKAGYQLAIVHNVGSDKVKSMGGNGKPEEYEIDIISAFISESAGYQFKQYTYDPTKSIKNQFTIQLDFENPFIDWSQYFFPFVVTLAVGILIMFCFFVIKCIRDRRRKNRHRLTKRHLRKIPIKKYDKADPYEVCAVCLDDYLEGDKLRVLPCNHAYHVKCIDPWLLKSRRVCPVCKRRVMIDGERERRGSRAGRPLNPDDPNSPRGAVGVDREGVDYELTDSEFEEDMPDERTRLLGDDAATQTSRHNTFLDSGVPASLRTSTNERDQLLGAASLPVNTPPRLSSYTTGCSGYSTSSAASSRSSYYGSFGGSDRLGARNAGRVNMYGAGGRFVPSINRAYSTSEEDNDDSGRRRNAFGASSAVRTRQVGGCRVSPLVATKGQSSVEGASLDDSNYSPTNAGTASITSAQLHRAVSPAHSSASSSTSTACSPNDRTKLDATIGSSGKAVPTCATRNYGGDGDNLVAAVSLSETGTLKVRLPADLCSEDRALEASATQPEVVTGCQATYSPNRGTESDRNDSHFRDTDLTVLDKTDDHDDVDNGLAIDEVVVERRPAQDDKTDSVSALVI